MNRRQAIRLGFAPLGLDLMGLLAARAGATLLPRAASGGLPPLRACIVVFYYGGPSQLETFDPKPEAPAEIRGEFASIATSAPGVRICEHLPRLARLMNRVALIRNMTHSNRLHDSASMETFTGRRPPQGDQELFAPAPQLFPSWGGVVNYMLRERGLPVGHAVLPFLFHNVVDVPCQGAGFLGPAFDPFRVEVDPAGRTYRAELPARESLGEAGRRGGRRRLLDQLDSRRDSPEAQAMLTNVERAIRLLDSEEIRDAIDLDREDPRLRERYGATDGPWEPGGAAMSEHAFARNMRGQNYLLACRLVEAGVPFVNVHDFRQQGQNWDTHARNFEQHRDLLLPAMDRGFSTLIEDLDARGLLESTLVIGLGEFGRTPRINTNAGRDHWPDCYSILLAGGGVRGGLVHGASDRFAAYPVRDPVTPADLAATIYWRVGIDPSSEIHDLQGRPFVLSEGQPVRALFDG